MTEKLQNFKLTENSGFGKIALIVGLVGLVAGAAGYFTDSHQFFSSYLTAWVFWVSLTLGGLFFTLLHHLTSADWSVVLRRISETAMITLPLMALLFIPIIFGMHDLYHWTHADAVAGDELLMKKAGWLNTTFFIIRTAVYFGIWFVVSRGLYKTSLAQDNGHSAELTAKMKKYSAPGMLLFAVTVTFAAFDWLMSLDPHWYSTIFGVYFFGGCLLAIFSFMTIFGLNLRSKGILSDTITVEHYHDLGKFLLAFTIFWGYIAFSQYFLIWYANIPEETVYYLRRWEGSWKIITLILVFCNFLIPFVVLLFRAPKRNMKFLNIMAIWIMVAHWIDIFWLVKPNFDKGQFHFSWMDIALTVGIGGLFVWYFWQKYSASALVPVNDPKLEVSIKFKNN